MYRRQYLHEYATFISVESIKNTKLISFIVMGYMLIALSWWTILLFQKNQQVYYSSLEKIKIEQGQAYKSSPEVKLLNNKYQRQKFMILGEGFVFGIMLILGIWLILRSFRKELEVAQRQNNFMLSITHELKSPIASIQLILDTLKRRTLAPEMQTDLVQSATEENLRLARLVDNILFLNKIDHQNSLHFEKLDLSQFIKDLASQYQAKYKNQHLSLAIEENCIFNFDRLAMEMALRNVIDNALKYSEQNMEVKLSLKRKGDQYILEILDQGIGIPNLEKERVLEKFYRIGNEETRTTTGTGLGLFITKEIIHSHRGKISIHDNSPKGTIIKITLAHHD